MQSLPLFDPNEHIILKNKLEKKYQQKLKKLRFITNVYKIKSLKCGNIKKLVRSPFLNKYSTLKWYWIARLEDFFLWANLYQLSYLKKISNKNLNEIKPTLDTSEEKLIEKILLSEFAKTFLTHGKTPSKFKNTCKIVMSEFLEYLIFFYKTHFIQKVPISNTLKGYVKTPEIGDGKNHINLLEHKLLLKKVGHVSYQVYSLNKFRVNNDELNLFFISEEFFKNKFTYFEQIQHIEKAISIIKLASPNSFYNFKNYTNGILAINSPGIVSYSSQLIPGISNINIYDRDFVDLIDDLIHETGHHHLNYYLNCYKIKLDDSDNKYYSPWRRSLRTLRGLYHAYFTFFMGMQLFDDLINFYEKNITMKLSKSQIDKIYFRFLEESSLLGISTNQLLLAIKEHKVSNIGQVLIKKIITKNAKISLRYKERLNTLNKRNPKLANKLKNMNKKQFIEMKHYKNE